MNEIIKIHNREIYLYGDPSADYRIIQPVNVQGFGALTAEIDKIQEYVCGRSFFLTVVGVTDWNRELSPWKSEAVFGNQTFGDGAEELLQFILKELLPYLEQVCGNSERKNYIIAGYSLAGLFTLWAAYRTERFSGVAAVSPSVWFPGWTEYAAEHRVKAKKVYLSLGKKEEKTHNQTMARVGSAIREQYKRLQDDEIFCILEWNEGNHFQECEERLAKGIAWLLRQTQGMQ